MSHSGKPIYSIKNMSKTRRNIIWKDIPYYNGIYKISNTGQVKSLTRKVSHSLYTTKTVNGRILKPVLNVHGYLQVSLFKNNRSKVMRIHQLVAITFLNHTPNNHEFVINHKDFNKLNNHVNNLEIVTNRENTNRKHLEHTSKYTGVSWNKRANKWEVRIYHENKNKNLGLFVNEVEAGKVYENELCKIT
jgi:hypothetical protein